MNSQKIWVQSNLVFFSSFLILFRCCLSHSLLFHLLELLLVTMSNSYFKNSFNVTLRIFFHYIFSYLFMANRCLSGECFSRWEFFLFFSKKAITECTTSICISGNVSPLWDSPSTKHWMWSIVSILLLEKNYTIFRDYTVQAMALNYITFLLFLVFIMLLDGMLYVSLFQ